MMCETAKQERVCDLKRKIRTDFIWKLNRNTEPNRLIFYVIFDNNNFLCDVSKLKKV